MPRGLSIRNELIGKSREAALSAVQSFNNPLRTFKTETFIVQMVIAWRSLLHAHFHQRRIEYRYYKLQGQRRRFQRTKSGEFKYWELEQCLKADECPLDETTSLNLRFLIGLRNEIEHYVATNLDEAFSGQYLACCLNYERYICELFGKQYSLGDMAAFTLQFRDITLSRSITSSRPRMPSNIARYISEFYADLTEEQISSHNFRRRFMFVPVTVNKDAQANEVIEFVRADSDEAKAMIDAYRQVVLKEVERPKYRPGEIVGMMRDDGHTRFSMHFHTQIWQAKDAKNPGKGYGVKVSGQWFWYERWVEVVREHCDANRVKYGN